MRFHVRVLHASAHRIAGRGAKRGSDDHLTDYRVADDRGAKHATEHGADCVANRSWCDSVTKRGTERFAECIADNCVAERVANL